MIGKCGSGKHGPGAARTRVIRVDIVQPHWIVKEDLHHTFVQAVSNGEVKIVLVLNFPVEHK